MLQGYVDQLISRLKEVTLKGNDTQDLTKWYNWTTFDIIGQSRCTAQCVLSVADMPLADLLFGEPFGCLQELSTHKYVEMLFGSLRAFRMSYILYVDHDFATLFGLTSSSHYFPSTKRFSNFMIDKAMLASRPEYYRWVHAQLKKRMERDTQRPVCACISGAEYAALT